MAKIKFKGGLAYSTNKDLLQDNYEDELNVIELKEQRLKIVLDTKQRAGKVVTIVEGFKGAGIEELGKKLKHHCGTGGAVKDGLIIIQGDNREKIFLFLLKLGYSNTRKS